MLVGKAGRLGLRALTGYAQQSQAVIGAALPAVATATAQQSCWMSAAAAQPAPVEGELQQTDLGLPVSVTETQLIHVLQRRKARLQQQRLCMMILSFWR